VGVSVPSPFFEKLWQRDLEGEFSSLCRILVLIIRNQATSKFIVHPPFQTWQVVLEGAKLSVICAIAPVLFMVEILVVRHVLGPTFFKMHLCLYFRQFAFFSICFGAASNRHFGGPRGSKLLFDDEIRVAGILSVDRGTYLSSTFRVTSTAIFGSSACDWVHQRLRGECVFYLPLQWVWAVAYSLMWIIWSVLLLRLRCSLPSALGVWRMGRAELLSV
jgi:hypothetical protein